MTSILLIAEAADADRQSLSRALMLARYLHARIEIVFFDAVHRYTPAARQYLDALRRSVTAPDVDIATDAAIVGSLQDTIAQKAADEGVGLVLKAAGHRRVPGGSHADWQLIRQCPTSLLLTQGRPWHPRAVLAAAVDIMDRSTPSVSRAIARMSSKLQIAFDADLALLYAQPEHVAVQAWLSEAQAHVSLRQLGREFEIKPQQVRVLRGQASQILPRFATENGCDLIALGAGDQPSFPQFVGSLCGQLLRATYCDLLFVKPGRCDAQRAPLSYEVGGAPWPPLPSVSAQ
jgi:universal stress protein E